MRMKRGSNINFFNKDGEWLSEIIFLDRDRVEVKFLNKLKESTKNSNIELAICLVKKGPMDIILQKATELGVTKIIPIISERTEVKELNFERAKKIVIEATEQSNQLIPPEISQVTKLKNFLNNLDGSTKLLFADVNSKDNLKKEVLSEAKSISVLVGPEGDFSPSEIELIHGNPNVVPFTISRNILRSDTAVISAISLVNFINNFH
jgi:16S rRNA (uracil1498-N3)-methyltransferase